MPNIVVVGMQWGDEGKGKIVDLLCPAFEAVARYQGGHNAGHTVKFADRHFSLHLIPSGILHPGIRCYLGNGMVVSPPAFLKELDGLRRAGVEVDGRLFLSERAQIIVPGLEALDAAREARLGDGKIGTTSRGIGPAYELKAARLGLRVCELVAGPERFGERLAAQVERLQWELRALGADPSAAFPGGHAALEGELARFGEALRPFACDVSRALEDSIDRGESVLFEGAQGTLLDVDFGTYPFVTSSSATAGGACTGCGVPPTRIDGVVGILKAYTTRVGGGPFPTELRDELGEHLRRRGNEYGTTTGRPRRCGWLDLVVARYARRLSGIGAVALTKLDVLDELDEILVCEAYEVDGARTAEMPCDVESLARAKPICRKVPGWRASTVGQLDYRKLPRAAREYVELIEERLEIPIDLLSTGPRREETIVRDAALGPWLGERIAAVTVSA